MCVEILLLLLYWEADNFCVFSGFLLFVLVESLPEKRGISGNKPILHNTREKAIQVVMRIRLSNRVLLLLLLSSVWSLVVVFYLSNSMSGGEDSSMDFTAPGSLLPAERETERKKERKKERKREKEKDSAVF